jgi:hypothetical protein
MKPSLRVYLSGSAHLKRYPIFQLQNAPPSPYGSTCRFYCGSRIRPGQYRIALSPGINDPTGSGKTPSSMSTDHATYTNLSTEFYHVTCFEELLDLTSPHYVSRFEADRSKHVPDHGAQVILEEYISRSKLRILQIRKREVESDEPVAESSSTHVHSPTAEVEEQQELAGKVQPEPAVPGPVTVVSIKDPIQRPYFYAVAVQLSSASKQAIESQLWTIADEIWEHKRVAESAATQENDQLFGESFCQFMVEHCN